MHKRNTYQKHVYAHLVLDRGPVTEQIFANVSKEKLTLSMLLILTSTGRVPVEFSHQSNHCCTQPRGTLVCDGSVVTAVIYRRIAYSDLWNWKIGIPTTYDDKRLYCRRSVLCLGTVDVRVYPKYCLSNAGPRYTNLHIIEISLIIDMNKIFRYPHTTTETIDNMLFDFWCIFTTER